MKNAYRLWLVKSEKHYIKNGFSNLEALTIINWGWDIDEDFTSKSEYIKTAKEYAKEISEKIGKAVDWKLMFGEPKESDYKYCSHCDCYFYASDGCCCDD